MPLSRQTWRISSRTDNRSLDCVGDTSKSYFLMFKIVEYLYIHWVRCWIWLFYSLGINVTSLVASFGKYLKFYVKKMSEFPRASSLDAFVVLKASQSRSWCWLAWSPSVSCLCPRHAVQWPCWTSVLLSQYCGSLCSDIEQTNTPK